MNAKKELIEILKDKPKVICGIVKDISYNYGEEGKTEFKLNKGYSKKEYNEWIDSLDFIYDSGFGGQELAGYVVLENGEWLERGEYDGSEWWEHKKCPDIF